LDFEQTNFLPLTIFTTPFWVHFAPAFGVGAASAAVPNKVKVKAKAQIFRFIQTKRNLHLGLKAIIS
jgi:hypothetical protein